MSCAVALQEFARTFETVEQVTLTVSSPSAHTIQTTHEENRVLSMFGNGDLNGFQCSAPCACTPEYISHDWNPCYPTITANLQRPGNSLRERYLPALKC